MDDFGAPAPPPPPPQQQQMQMQMQQQPQQMAGGGGANNGFGGFGGAGDPFAAPAAPVAGAGGFGAFPSPSRDPFAAPPPPQQQPSLTLDRPLNGIRVVVLAGESFAAAIVARELAQQSADVVLVYAPNRTSADKLTADPSTNLYRMTSADPFTDLLLGFCRVRHIDLKTPKGRSEVRRLIREESDVLVEGFRPGTLHRLLDGRDPSDLNSSVICLSLPGFAPACPYSALRAWEGVVAAVSGVYSDMGLNRRLMGRSTSYSPLPLASVYASALGLASIVFALLARRRHGRGDTIVVPLSSALHDALAHNSISFELPPRYEIPRKKAIRALAASRTAGTDLAPLSYDEVQNLLDPFYATYRCGDGRPFYLVAASHARHQRRALDVLGLTAAALSLGLLPAVLPVDGVDSDEQRRYGSDDAQAHRGLGANPYDPTAWAVLRPLLRTAFLSKPAFEWEQIFDEARVPGAAHRTTSEWVRSPHAIESGLIVVVEEEDAATTEQAGSTEATESTTESTAVEKAARPTRSKRRPGPIAWCRTYKSSASEGASSTSAVASNFALRDVKKQHDLEAKADIAAQTSLDLKIGDRVDVSDDGATFEHVQRAVGTGGSATLPPRHPRPPHSPEGRASSASTPIGWLDGLKVLDACNVIAGPTVASVLARFGATVIKLDGAKPTYSPEVSIIYGLAANAGKDSSILLDLRSDQGRGALNELISWANVITINAPGSALSSLGLSPEQILAATKGKAEKPILMHFDAWSGPLDSIDKPAGNRSDALGYDDCLQAALGIMERFGGSITTPEEHAHVGTIDVVAGFAGAYATALALFEADTRHRRLASGKKATTANELIVAKTSLAATGNLLVAPFMNDDDDDDDDDDENVQAHRYGRLARGPDALGEHALHRIYECSDGKCIFLAALGPLMPMPRAKQAAVEALARATLDRTLIESVATSQDACALDDASIAAVLSSVFKTNTSGYWVELLSTSRSYCNIELTCVPLNTIAELRAANTRDKAEESQAPLDLRGSFGFERCSDHPLGSPVTLFDTRLSVRPQSAVVQSLCPAPKYGADTVRVLTDVCGLDGETIDSMITVGSASTQWSKEYLPGSTTRPGKSSTNNAKRSSEVEGDICPICLSEKAETASWLELTCGHGCCRKCLSSAAKQGHRSCPVCRRPHELELERLVEQSVLFKSGYSNWRQGKSRGAHGEISKITEPREAPSARALHLVITTEKQAGDIHIAKFPTNKAATPKSPHTGGEDGAEGEEESTAFAPQALSFETVVTD